MPPATFHDGLRHVRTVLLERDAENWTDGQLLDRFLARQEEAAFEVLVRRHGPMVFGVCRRVLRQAHDAEDAFQATFLVLVRKADSLRDRETIGNWLYGVAYHTALKARAAAAKRRAKEAQVKTRSQTVGEVLASEPDWLPLLDLELSRLPDKFREAVVLCDVQGKTRQEAARELGIPPGTLSGRLTTARRLLAQRLARQGVTLSAGAALLSPCEGSAAVPAALVDSTVHAAALTAAGQATADAVSASTAALSERVMRMMSLTNWKKATMVVLALGLIAGGGLLAHGLRAQQPVPAGGEPVAAAAVAPVGGEPAAAAAPTPAEPEAQPKSWQKRDAWPTLAGEAYALAFSPDGKTLAAGIHCFGKVVLWDRKTGKIRTTATAQPKQERMAVLSLAFSPDGQRLAVAGGSLGAEVTEQSTAWFMMYDVAAGKFTEVDHQHTNLITCVAFSPDGKAMATSSWDRIVNLFDAATGKVRLGLLGHTSSVTGVAFSPDSKTLASASFDSTVRLWDVPTGKQKRVLGGPGPYPICNGVAFSPDGKTVAVGTWEKTPQEQCAILVYDVDTGKETVRLAGHPGWIQAVAFAPDGKTLASGGLDKVVRVWDVTTGRQTAALEGQRNRTAAVAFSPDGRTLAAAGFEDQVHLWEWK